MSEGGKLLRLLSLVPDVIVPAAPFGAKTPFMAQRGSRGKGGGCAVSGTTRGRGWHGESSGNCVGSNCLLLNRKSPMAALIREFCSVLSEEPHGVK